jgi:hypothetical protein
MTSDPVDHPTHYTSHPSGVECITVTEHMGFCLGNAVKYIWRADLEQDAIQDLEKAVWYLQREIAKRQAAPRETGDAWEGLQPPVGWVTSATLSAQPETFSLPHFLDHIPALIRQAAEARVPPLAHVSDVALADECGGFALEAIQRYASAWLSAHQDDFPPLPWS